MGVTLVDKAAGVFAGSVVAGSAAAIAGLQQGMQFLAVDGVDVTREQSASVRQRLDHTGNAHEVVVQFNPREFSAASDALRFTAGDKHIQTVIVDRNSSGTWGFSLTGGVEEGTLRRHCICPGPKFRPASPPTGRRAGFTGKLISVAELNAVNYVAVSERELRTVLPRSQLWLARLLL